MQIDEERPPLTEAKVLEIHQKYLIRFLPTSGTLRGFTKKKRLDIPQGMNGWVNGEMNKVERK